MGVSAGYEQRRNEVYSWDGTKRGTAPFLVIQHTTLGEGRLDYAGTRYRLTPGKTMIITIPHAHRYWLERGGEWEYFWLLLNGREALRLAREILDSAGPVLEPTTDQVDRLAAACLEMLELNLSPGRASTSAYAAMACLHDTAFASRQVSDNLIPANIGRVVAHIETNIAAPLPVDRLAAVADLSRAHFVRIFTSATGSAPSDFVLEKRLERAERLLLATEMRVAEIAQATGFSDANYLAKVFRRRRDMAPLEFRAAARNASL
ncbi:AraC family transcriptional regulator [Devosia soli]|nr:AraC family transcriptional regulator [Devosia soli]